jgi:precorrin-3B synthase
LTVHPAADGGLARVRTPGGLVSQQQLQVLAGAARELGSGRLELTSRGNVQLRGLPPGAEAELGNRLAAAGLLPSATHERVRNIVASPLAGLDRPVPLAGTVEALDRELCGRPALADLPGRFLFAIDDGRGDVAALGADVTAIVGPDGGVVEGFAVRDVAAAMLAVAEAFLVERAAQGTPAWRIDELAGGCEAVRTRVQVALGARAVALDVPGAPPAPAGEVRQLDGRTALCVLAPLGRLSADQVSCIAEVASTARITPWRSVVIPDLDASTEVAVALAAVGLGVNAASPWHGVSACTGRPGCAKSLADVQADAQAALGRWPGRVVHWSGCSRRCGRPRDTSVDVVATTEGYRIDE